MRATTRRQRASPCSVLAGAMHMWQLRFPLLWACINLGMTTKCCEYWFGATNKFWHVGEFSSIEFMNNKDWLKKCLNKSITKEMEKLSHQFVSSIPPPVSQTNLKTGKLQCYLSYFREFERKKILIHLLEVIITGYQNLIKYVPKKKVLDPFHI